MESLFITLLGTTLIGQALTVDFSKFVECADNWEVKYPYLVEVRYTGEPFIGEEPQRNYHKNRHGSLLTQNSVLTRGHDLDNFPDSGEVVHPNIEECIKRRSDQPCLYVNTRRPRNNYDPEAEMCGFNSMVEKVYQHPFFLKTARQKFYDLYYIWANMKFPFAVLKLKEKIPIAEGHTIFPSLILPRTPLDMLYRLRRIATMGHDSKLCEYPHYDKLSHEGRYGPYSKLVTLTPLDCMKDDWERKESDKWECFVNSLCPKNSVHDGTWEGVRVVPSESGLESIIGIVDYLSQTHRKLCEENLIYPNYYNNSFILFNGEVPAFVAPESPDLRRFAVEDKLGAPIVCNGVALAMTSTWNGRGTGRRDVYIGTSFFRGWVFINKMRKKFQDPKWNRAPDDDPFLGESYTFKKKNIPKRDYDKSIFELSLNEEISPRPKSLAERVLADLATETILSILIFSR